MSGCGYIWSLGLWDIGIGIGKLIRQTPNTRQNEQRPFFSFSHHSFAFLFFSFTCFAFFFFFSVAFAAAAAFLCQLCSVCLRTFPHLKKLSLSLSLPVYAVYESAMCESCDGNEAMRSRLPIHSACIM